MHQFWLYMPYLTLTEPCGLFFFFSNNSSCIWSCKLVALKKRNKTPQLTAFSTAGGQYLTISDPKGKEGRVAHLILPLGHMAQAGDLCLSFRHKVPGLHSGALQVFVKKNGAHGPAVWGRNGGHGWRQTHITLRGLGIKSVSTDAHVAFWGFA